MFLNHFKFTSQPFAERAPADALWPDERMQQGLARLRYVAEHGTVGLVTGASGVGKSALLKRFMHELSGPGWQPVYLHLTHLPAAGMLKVLVSTLDEAPRRGKDRLLQQILEKARQAEGTLLVILDEAHLLNVEALTDIRLLISSALDDAPPLKIVLVGQEPPGLLSCHKQVIGGRHFVFVGQEDVSWTREEHSSRSFVLAAASWGHVCF